MEHNRSMLEGFRECPRWFARARSEVNDLGSSSGPALRGIVEHEILSRYVRHLAETQRSTDLAMLAFLTEQVVAETPGLEADQIEEVADDMETFASRFLPDTTGLVAIEKPLRVRLTETDTVYGTPDVVRVVGPVGYVDDYKSNWRAWTQSECESAFQLRGCYAVLVAEVFGCSTVHCRYVFVKSGVERTFTMAADDIAKSREQLRRLVEQVRTCTEWEPRPGARCGWCSYASDCPVSDAMSIRNVDDARRMAGAVLQLEAQLKMRLAALKAWVDVNGRIEVNGEEFLYMTSRVPTFEVAGILDVCDRNTWERVLKVNEKIKTRWFQEKWGKALEKYARENVSTRFGHRAVTEKGAGR